MKGQLILPLIISLFLFTEVNAQYLNCNQNSFWYGLCEWVNTIIQRFFNWREKTFITNQPIIEETTTTIISPELTTTIISQETTTTIIPSEQTTTTIAPTTTIEPISCSMSVKSYIIDCFLDCQNIGEFSSAQYMNSASADGTVVSLSSSDCVGVMFEHNIKGCALEDLQTIGIHIRRSWSDTSALCHLEIWNFNNSKWDVFYEKNCGFSVGNYYNLKVIVDSASYVDSAGNIKIRFRGYSFCRADTFYLDYEEIKLNEVE